MSVWSELRKQEEKKPTIWDTVKKESQAPSVKANREHIPVRASNILPPGTISFDIETDTADNMWRSDSSFLRLIGYSIDDEEPHNTTSPEELLRAFEETDGWIVSHNGLNYDLVILSKYCGLDLLQLAKQGRLYDTKLAAFLADPPPSRSKKGEIDKRYSLENQGQLYLGIGKLGDLKAIAKKYGGYDKIPTDDQEYNDYLKQDVRVARDLAKVVSFNDYTLREHKIAAITAEISLQGFRVDVELLNQRIKEGEDKRIEILDSLVAYGLPSADSTKSPHRTNAGKQAIDTAFRDLGVELPRTPKSGGPAFGKEVLQGVIDETDSEEVTDLAEAILSLNGIRTINLNVSDNLVGDRVHPTIDLRQSTGRLSITDPGLTVLGKKGGKYREREIFLAEPGEMIVAFDLAQIDQRAVAALCQDYNYLDMFEPGKDFHSEVAERVWGDRSRREDAKPICVPLDTEILTKVGWKTWNTVSVGDETLGLGEDGKLHWTPITAVNKYEDTGILRLEVASQGTNRFDVLCTPNHTWVSDWRRGYNDSRPKYYTRTMREAANIHSDDNLVLSAIAETPRVLDISDDEAELIGWMLGDGSLKWSALGGTSQGKYGEKRSVTFSIHQAKLQWVERLNLLTKQGGLDWRVYGPYFRSGFGGKLGKFEWRLASADARNLLSRAGFPLPTTAGTKLDLDLNSFVINLDPTQRESFLDGFWGAEGHMNGNTRTATQATGVIMDAVQLAVFLTGHLATRTNHSTEGIERVTWTKARVTGQKMVKSDAGKMDVWCPTTKLGTWIMRQGNQIMLTGNSHGTAYGMGVKRLANTAKVTEYEAGDIIKNMHNQFPRLVTWQGEIREQAELGVLLDNGFGRNMRCDVDRAYTQSIGMMGQGCARDLLMEGILRLWYNGGDEIIRRLRCIVHDELVMSLPKNNIEELERLVVDSLSFEWCPSYGSRPVQIEAGVSKRGDNWGNVYSK